jgi:hypothetical protein
MKNFSICDYLWFLEQKQDNSKKRDKNRMTLDAQIRRAVKERKESRVINAVAIDRARARLTSRITKGWISAGIPTKQQDKMKYEKRKTRKKHLVK